MNARPFGLQSRRLEKSDHRIIECRVVIEDHVPIRTSFGKSFAELLDNPIRCWVVGHIEVQNPAPPMLNYEKPAEQLECYRRHCEEIEGGDHLAMILQERQPAACRGRTGAECLADSATLRSESTNPSF
jgi:hypothetical protein